MPYSHSVVYAFIAFLHTDSLLPAVHKSIDVACSLLLMTKNLDPGTNNPVFSRLVRQCRELLHDQLTLDNAALVYETGSLGGEKALQIRALRMMIGAQTERSESRGLSVATASDVGHSLTIVT